LLELIIKAVITGFILSVLIGPVFFMLLEISIRKGVRAALSFDLGVLLSDIIYILIALVFYNELDKILTGDQKYLFQLGGGLVFVVFGTFILIKKPKSGVDEENIGIQTKDYLMLGLRGFLLNFANPAVIFYWLSVIALGAKRGEDEHLSQRDLYLYIVLILVTFFSVDILKVIGAKKLRPFITDKVLLGLNRLTGLIIFITGIVLILKGIIFLVELNDSAYMSGVFVKLIESGAHISR